MPEASGYSSASTTRGFTGHEQLDPVALVHMNGRVYDPDIGRFASPDILIQDRLNLQSWNAYSYVHNNPLSYTDPSGFVTDPVPIPPLRPSTPEPNNDIADPTGGEDPTYTVDPETGEVYVEENGEVSICSVCSAEPRDDGGVDVRIADEVVGASYVPGAGETFRAYQQLNPDASTMPARIFDEGGIYRIELMTGTHIGAGHHHTYVLFTDTITKDRFIVRGGPGSENDFFDSAKTALMTEAGGYGSVAVSIFARWDEGLPVDRPSELTNRQIAGYIISNQVELRDRLRSFASEVHSREWPYSPVQHNSNSVAGTLLRDMGFDSIQPNNWAIGFNRDLTRHRTLSDFERGEYVF